jgi:hypothetical protein
MTYKEQLQSEEWKAKRLEILERDGHKCVACESTNRLQVHHSKYDLRLKAWEYDNMWLVTLCHKCHKEEHREISNSFRVGTIKDGEFIERVKVKKPRKPRRVYMKYEQFKEIVLSFEGEFTLDNLDRPEVLKTVLYTEMGNFKNRMIKEKLIKKVSRKKLYFVTQPQPISLPL